MGKAKATSDEAYLKELKDVTLEREIAVEEKRMLNEYLKCLEEKGDMLTSGGVSGSEWTCDSMAVKDAIENNNLRFFYNGRLEIRSHEHGKDGMFKIYYPHIRTMRKKGFTIESLEFLDRLYDSSNSNNERLKLMQPSEVVYYLLDH